MGFGAAISLLAPPAMAQKTAYDNVRTVGVREEFDISGGMFDVLEYPAASSRLREGAKVGIRFQIEEGKPNLRWASILGFSFCSEDGLNSLQADFADLPLYENLALAAEFADYTAKKRENLAQVLTPGFKRRDVHEIGVAVEDGSTVAMSISGQRRSFKLAFKPHRLLVRPSGVKGWIEFIGPAIA